MRDLIADLESSDVETVYDAIISAGKTNRRELRPRIEALLTSSDPGLREAALKTVAFYWRLPEHETTARRALREDIDPDVRAAAAMALGGYPDGADALAPLLEVALDANEEEGVRDAAYSSALIVASVSRAEYPMERTIPGFEERANWPLLARVVHAHGADVPKRLRELAQQHGSTAT